jgi:hypothetical protein
MIVIIISNNSFYYSDECLNQDFKRNAHKHEIPKDVEALKRSTRSHLLSIRNDPRKEKNDFCTQRSGMGREEDGVSLVFLGK